MGETLNCLLQIVIDGISPNKKEELLIRAEKMKNMD